MASEFGQRLLHAWNIFINKEEKEEYTDYSYSSGYSSRPDRTRLSRGNERSILSSILTHISIDAAAVPLKHVKLDENENYVQEIKSGLHDCLTVEANIDQAARAFRQDIILTMFDKGVVAVVPIETTLNPLVTGGFDIKSLRVGIITEWYPKHVLVDIYDERDGKRKSVKVEKKIVAIIENPFYQIMNEPNSTLQRLIRKLNMLDAVDEITSSGKLDLIIQLPYVIKTARRREEADRRRKDIESQLKDAQYGIAYTDGTEKITQLNRPAENKLLKQVEFLTNLLYSQLGVTDSVLSGTADEKTMLNYYNRTIEPILGAITEAMARTFLTKTARTQNQSIIYLRDPFRLVAVADMAEIADKMTRNEILSSNEVRSIIGFKPSTDPKADKLINKNIPEPEPPTEPAPQPEELEPPEGDIQNES